MRKIIFITLMFLSITSFSQSKECNCSIGIKVGMNFSSITDATGLSNRTGYQAGFFAGVKFNDFIGIQADLLYSQQGADFDLDKLDLNYINIPVLFKYYVIRGLNLQAGPQFGFVMNDNFEDFFEDVEAEKFDLTGVVGVGYDLFTRIKLEARYNFGITDIRKDEDWKNTVVSLSLGYSFL
jgi:opacity protein-like surface antigen